jgi:predicted nucleic acid-binding protein
MTKYVFDTNVFINLQRRQPIDIYPSVWEKIGSLMKDGVIISSQEVYDEIVVGGDVLENWAKKRRECFIPSEITVQQKVRAILREHRGLVEGGKRKNSADPFVIALAQEKNCKVVTEETRTRSKESPKIPDVCDYYHVECIDFVGFSREMKLAF